MAYRLALHMGRLDVDSMLEEMTPQQFDKWWAYYRNEPFGDWWTLGAKLLHVLKTAHFDGYDGTEEGERLKWETADEADSDPLNEKAIAARYGNHRNTRR